MFWTVGGTDAEPYGNANEGGPLGARPTTAARFRPGLHTTLRAGIETPVEVAPAPSAPQGQCGSEREKRSPVTAT